MNIEKNPLIHEIMPFDTSFQYIPSLLRCGGVDSDGDCVTGSGGKGQAPQNILTNDTSYCPIKPDPRDSPQVNDVDSSLSVLDTSTDRHWAYTAFYEPEGWTEDTAPMIKGVRHLLPRANACFMRKWNAVKSLILVCCR